MTFKKGDSVKVFPNKFDAHRYNLKKDGSIDGVVVENKARKDIDSSLLKDPVRVIVMSKYGWKNNMVFERELVKNDN